MQALDTARPWDLTTIQRLLMEGFTEGARLAARDEAVRKDALEATHLKEAFGRNCRREAYQAAWRLSHSLAANFPDSWSLGLNNIIASATEAALVLGARMVGCAERDGAFDLPDLAEDELWLGPEVDRLLQQVVESLVGAGHPVPGAQAFIDRTCPAPEPNLIDLACGDSQEVRTTWIRDADIGRMYQWSVARAGAKVVVAKRFRGSKATEVDVTIPVRDLQVLMRMLRRVQPRSA